jgi:hypothetical protein
MLPRERPDGPSAVVSGFAINRETREKLVVKDDLNWGGRTERPPMKCDHTGGSLVPQNGNWTGAAEGDTSIRRYRCMYCGDIFEVKRKNIQTELVGNCYELD